MPRIHLIDNLGAVLVIARPHDPAKQVVALVDKSEPRRLVLNLARLLLPHDERCELAWVLLAC